MMGEADHEIVYDGSSRDSAIRGGTMQPSQHAAAAWPTGGGEMGVLVRAHDWRATPLGAVEAWPQSLRTSVDLILDAEVPMTVWWGPALVQIYNDAYRGLVGAKHPHILGRPARQAWSEAWDVMGPKLEGVFSSGRPMAKANQARMVERCGCIEEAFFTISCSAIRDESGAVGGVLTVVTETTGHHRADLERDRAEEALRASQARLQAAIDLVGLSLYSWSPQGGTPDWDPRAKALWGLPPETQMNADLWRAGLHPEDRDRVEAAVMAALDPHGDGIYDAEYRVIGIGDGVERWVASRSRTTFEGGRPVHVSGAVLDITARKRAEEHLKLLLAELQHRVRNVMAVVRSIARRTGETSETLEDYAMHLDGRLDALGRAQALVTRDPAAGVDLEYLIAEELLAHAAHDGEQITLAGPTVRLKSKAAETIGLAMHELAANAVKYGALSRDGGRIAVTWSIEGREKSAPLLRFAWTERGVPDAVAGPRRRGFGSELIERTLAYELGASAALDFTPDGLRCTIDLPLAERIAILGEAPAWEEGWTAPIARAG